MQKKRKLANLITLGALAAILLAAVLAVGVYMGWFTSSEAPAATVTGCTGLVSLERGGIASPISGEMALQAGDRLELADDAHATLRLDTGWIDLDEGTSLTVTNPDAGDFQAEAVQGTLFAVTDSETLSLSFLEGTGLECSGAVCSLTLDSTGGALAIYDGEATLTGQKTQTVIAGQSAVLTQDGFTIQALDITGLEDAAVEQLLALAKSRALCFTGEELNQLIADRESDAQAELEAALLDQVNARGAADAAARTAQAMAAALSAALEAEPEDADAETSGEDAQPQESEEGGNSKPETSNEGESGSKPENSDSKPAGSGEPETTPEEEPEPEPEETETVSSYTCTISIRCDTILNNMDQLDDSKTSYVPSSGVILSTTSVSFTEGETVYDVLKRACSAAGIQMEASGGYVEGINHLYEFDCGQESGWMYKVNGSFPSKGCSSYLLSQGDSIVWCYTCTGLGADVGA